MLSFTCIFNLFLNGGEVFVSEKSKCGKPFVYSHTEDPGFPAEVPAEEHIQ